MCSHELISTPADGPLPGSLDAIEQEICDLASHIHAATCRWLSLVAEFDRREGWGPWGCRSCAHWVSWRCGIAPVAAREHVRVARRLSDLPLIRASFARGELSYSKVRALTRVDGIEREEELLELARHATASQLERLVRAYRGVVAVEQRARGVRAERWVTWHHDDDGSLVFRGRLPAEEGAVVVAAFDAAVQRLIEEGTPAADHGGEGASAEAAGAARRDPEPRVRQLESASAEAPGDEDRRATPPVATLEDASAEALVLDAGEARADALVLMAETLLAGAEASRTGGDRYQVVVHLDAATLREDGASAKCELADGTPIASETARRLACDAAIVPLLERAGRPLSVGRKTRAIPPALQRALAARDRGCRFPGCTARHFIDAHHIEHWAHGGATELNNLVQLCRHHHRLLHEGGYSIHAHGDGGLTFRRADGRRIAACPAVPRGHVNGVHTRRIRPEACVSLSNGERMDLALAVDAMLAFAPPTTAEAPGI